jgi:hypothetical protein
MDMKGIYRIINMYIMALVSKECFIASTAEQGTRSIVSLLQQLRVLLLTYPIKYDIMHDFKG